jgi:hypothetical protein
MEAAITAASALGTAVSIPACGSYQFMNPIAYNTAHLGSFIIPNGMKIFTPGGYQCVRFQVSGSWTSPFGQALIQQTTPTQGVTIRSH